MPFLWGKRFGIPEWVSGPYVNAMLLAGALGLGGYSAARAAGNPMRIHMDENGVWRWMTRLDHQYWQLSKAADQARRNPANERALLDIEIRRMRLRADVTAAENQSGISADDIAIDARDLRFRPEDNTDEEADEDAISGRR